MPQISPTPSTFKDISICFWFMISTIWDPNSSFLAKWFATLDKVLLLAIPMLTGIPIHFFIIFLIPSALKKKLLSEYLFSIKNASSME